MTSSAQVLSSEQGHAQSANEFRILIFTGHSGGHLFPAIAFSESLIKAHPSAKIQLVTSEKGRGIMKDFSATFDQVHFLPRFPLPAGISLATVFFLMNLLRAFALSFLIIRRMKPQLAVGFGSYASYPGMRLSAMLGIPTLIHEQNKVPGKATLMLAKHVDRIAVTFSDTEIQSDKVIRVGLPIRGSLLSHAGARKDRTDRLLKLFVTGGSQGAHRLNEVVCDALNTLSDEEKKTIVVNHITGQQDEKEVRERYQNAGVNATVYSFTNEIEKFYREADLAITRAGSNTLFELASYAVPSIVVPYPYAGSHQAANAQNFADKNAVIVRDEKLLNPDWLKQQIQLLLHRREERERLSGNISKLATPDAAEKLVDLALGMIEEKIYEKKR